MWKPEIFMGYYCVTKIKANYYYKTKPQTAAVILVVVLRFSRVS